MTSLKPRLGGTQGAEGTLSPQPVLSDGARLDDRVGYGWAILLQPGTRHRLGRHAAAWAAANRATIVDDVAVRGWLDSLGADAVVLRPDRYVHAAVASLEELDARLGSKTTATEASGIGQRPSAAIVEA